MRLLQAGRELRPVLCTSLEDRRGQDADCRSLRGWAGPRATWRHLATPGNQELGTNQPGVKWGQVGASQKDMEKWSGQEGHAHHSCPPVPTRPARSAAGP